MAGSASIAKGSHATNVARCRVKRSGMMGPEGYSFMVNTAVKYTSFQGRVERAEDHMTKLDFRQGYQPEVASFNALLLSVVKSGDFEKADRWFARLEEPRLHPELGEMKPDARSYNIMIQAVSEASDLKRVEKYMEEMRTLYKPSRTSYYKVIQAFVCANEAKRAHYWLEVLVCEGCDQCDDYEAEKVRDERSRVQSRRRWEPTELTNLVIAVTRCLADARNTTSADRWLEYLLGCGYKPQDETMVAIWEHVRDAAPREIVPARLYSESTKIPAVGEPCVQIPMALSGEQQVLPLLTLPPATVDVKEDLKKQPDLAALPWTLPHEGAQPKALFKTQDSLRSTWGASTTPRSARGRILASNLKRRADANVAAAMVLASPVVERAGYLQRLQDS